jgi:RimJ/RimL family protein N-acetyltransferase
MDSDFLDQALGPRLNWHPVPRPDRRTLHGHHVSLQPLNPDAHADDLYRASHGDQLDPALWLYMSYGPWNHPDEFRKWIQTNSESDDPLFYAIVPTDGEAAGQATYLRIDEHNGVIEIGHIWFSPSIQRSRAATEAIYLLARHAFDELGYRRFEWKCHARNKRSRRAAERFGFTYEGTFRKAIVQRDRNRDTAWYAIIDDDWPKIRDAFETWLSDDNFDTEGRQRRSLGEIRSAS